MIAALVAAVAGVWFGVKALFPDSSKPAADPHGPVISVKIPEGTDAAGIGSLLEDAGVVDDGSRFRNYAKDQGEGAEFKAGTYRFRAGMDYDTIIAQLDKGPVAAPVSKLVIPEGYRTTEIADRVTT
ncbi:MAG: endolytic transglycosylase MltG, partial [Gaiellales bacterium]